ncbi:YihY/virulence factor BrkB family protein [Halovulum sp. GXIMD14794]
MSHPGEFATSPFAIPRAGWKAVLLRVKDEISRDRVGLVAAGIAFYGLLALFPAIAALVAVAGLIVEPEAVAERIDDAVAMMPDAAAEIVTSQVNELAATGETALGLAALAGILLAVYSASKGVSAFMQGLNVAYEEEETRGFLRRTLTVLVLTLVMVLGAAAGIAAGPLVPALLALVELGAVTELLVAAARWLVLALVATCGIAVLYRYGPSRAPAQWTWLMPGALLASALWLAASVGFSIYAENFATYNESFGALAGVVILLMWLWISAYVLLLGAELNAEAEAQTRHDTTAGRGMPMGERGARKADILAESGHG